GPPDRYRRPPDLVLAVVAPTGHPARGPPGVRALLRPESERHRGARRDAVRGEPQIDRQRREPLLLRPRSRRGRDRRTSADRAREGAAPPRFPGSRRARDPRRSEGPGRPRGLREVPWEGGAVEGLLQRRPGPPRPLRMLSRAARAIRRASRSASGVKSFASALRCTARTKWRHSSVYGSCPRTGTFLSPRSVVRTDLGLGNGPPR